MYAYPSLRRLAERHLGPLPGLARRREEGSPSGRRGGDGWLRPGEQAGKDDPLLTPPHRRRYLSTVQKAPLSVYQLRRLRPSEGGKLLRPQEEDEAAGCLPQCQAQAGSPV